MYSKIEKLLKEKNISLFAIAKECKIPCSTLYEWKRRGTILSGKYIIMVSAYLGIRPEEML